MQAAVSSGKKPVNGRPVEQTPKNLYKRAQVNPAATDALKPTTKLSSGDQSRGSATGQKKSLSSSFKAPVGKMQQQQQAIDRLNAPLARKQRGSGVTQAGLRQNEQAAAPVGAKP